MATINYSIKSKKSFAPIYVRMQHYGLFDFKTPLPIYVQSKNFDRKSQKIKRVSEVPNHEELNQSLIDLKNKLFSEFNNGIITGQNFTKKWFDNAINNYFNLSLNTKKSFEKIFFTDWCDHWIENIAPNYKISSDEYISESVLKHYKSFINVFKDFQDDEKIELKNITEELLDLFGEYLIHNRKYGYDYSKRLIKRLQFFCRQAALRGIDVNPQFESKVVLSKETKKDCVDPYLSPEEIDQIFNLDLSHDPKLDNARDNLIISVWTGLRVSDFLRLDINNIQEGNIEIQSTQKTGIGVIIPIHPMVQTILDKRNGNLPRTISDQRYNDYIKDVTKLAGLTNVIYGSKLLPLLDEKTKQPLKDESGKVISRKTLGDYPKWELVTSHIGRRSFATNLFGKVPNSVIMATGGWKSEQMMLSYIKKTKNDHVRILADYWNTQQTASSNLKVVNQ